MIQHSRWNPNQNQNWQYENSCIPSYGCNMDKTTTTRPMGFVVVDEVKPSRSKVEIQELLDDDLMANVRVSPLKRAVVKQEDKIDSWPMVFYTEPQENHWIEPNHFVLSMESQVLIDKEPITDEVWLPFSSQDVESFQLVNTERPTSGKKFQKIVSRYNVRLSESANRSKVPYVQFYCSPKMIKHHGNVYKRGDLITVIIKHPEYPLHWPSPPLITVKPSAEQTYIPMLSKQRLCLVTDSERHTVEYKPNAAGTIKLVGTMQADFSKECNIFNCSKPTSASEVIYVNSNSKSKKKKVRRVTIPMTEKDPRCPILLNPTVDSVIYSTNIDGFVIRFWKSDYHPIVIMDPAPIRCVHTSENSQCFERRFEVDKRRPFFYLNRKDNAWVLS